MDNQVGHVCTVPLHSGMLLQADKFLTLGHRAFRVAMQIIPTQLLEQIIMLTIQMTLLMHHEPCDLRLGEIIAVQDF